MFKRICKITFISHGATVYTMGGIIGCGLKYPKLNDFGQDELRKVCDYLKQRGVSYDNIFTCPDACCAQSAQIIAKLFKQKSKIIDLPSRNYGEWQGMLYSDIMKNKGPEVLAQCPLGGEPIEAFNKRVSDIIDRLVYENKGTRIIVVATPGIIGAAVAKTLGLTVENQHKVLIKTGSLTQISYFDTWSSLIYSDYCPL